MRVAARTGSTHKRLPGPPPDEASLRQAALNHLARYGTTQSNLLRVLVRRIDRWAHAADALPEHVAASKVAAQAVVNQLATLGVVNDAAFAESRARSLHRAGRSRRAITAHLQAKGVPAGLVELPDDPDLDLSAAVLYAARRRMGPFRLRPDAQDQELDTDGPGPDPSRPRDLARLARAGFPASVAQRVLSLPPDEAERMLFEARRT